MDRFDMAIALIQEAQREQKRLSAFNKEMEKLTYKDPDYWSKRMAIENRYSPLPHKSVVNDNLKMARRILIGEYM